MPSTRHGENWTRDEVILALHLYCQIPFAQTKANNPRVIELARLLGRSSASVARKLGNLGAADTSLREKGISGLAHTAKVDRTVWDEFGQDWPALVAEVERITNDFGTEPEYILPVPEWAGATEKFVTGISRRCQAFFRLAVLSSYEFHCCMCGLDIPALLTAAHIVSWAEEEKLRADPQNGLCLCALHHSAFDAGLIAVNDDYRIVTSSLIGSSRSDVVRTMIVSLQDQPLTQPTRFAPRADLIRQQYERVFKP